MSLLHWEIKPTKEFPSKTKTIHKVKLLLRGLPVWELPLWIYPRLYFRCSSEVLVFKKTFSCQLRTTGAQRDNRRPGGARNQPASLCVWRITVSPLLTDSSTLFRLCPQTELVLFIVMGLCCFSLLCLRDERFLPAQIHSCISAFSVSIVASTVCHNTKLIKLTSTQRFCTLNTALKKNCMNTRPQIS